jgi:hypothetical protein
MKKLASLVLAGALAATMAISTSAAYEAEADLNKVAFNVQKANVAQKLDGKISDGEYYKIDLKSSWISYAANKDADLTSAKSTNKELYMSWDTNGINIATNVTLAKDKYTQTQTAANIWKEACIQVNLAGVADTGTKRLEYGIGKTTSDYKFISNVWNQGVGTYAATEGKNAFVDYVDGKLIYETTVPWSNFLADTAVKESSQFKFCLVWAIGKGEDYIHIQLASGCTGTPGKKVDNFAKLTLAAAPAVTKPAATTTTTTTTTSVKTADMSIIVSASMLALSIAGVVIFSRKKH